MAHHWSPRRDKSGYFSDSTIAALASGLGGPIAIVRMSGPQSLDALRSILEIKTTITPRLMSRGKFSIDGRIYDDLLYVFFENPNSFTGEDLVEFHLHGNGLIVEKLLERLFQGGIRQALPGEFSFRAVRNGKMKLDQAQAVSDLISAPNEVAIEMAIEKLSGAQFSLIHEIHQALKHLATLSEVGIDFTDQDLDEVSLDRLKQKLKPVLIRLLELEKSFDRGFKIQHGLSTCFLGKPNVGKSSLFNSLLGESRSIVSAQPGTTRDSVSESLTLQDETRCVTLKLTDTAGWRKTHNEIENLGIERTKTAIDQSEVVLLIFDLTAVSEDELLWVQGFDFEQKIVFPVLNKSDLVSENQIRDWKRVFQTTSFEEPTTTSSKTGEGIQDLVQKIVQRLSKGLYRNRGEVLLTKPEHLISVRESITDLNRAIHSKEIELFSSDIRQALHSLSPLIGETLTDDILEKIFSEFCIGK